MSDISNKTLVALLVIAIVVSLAGTWISIGKLREITGFQSVGTTPQGTVQIQQVTGREITLWNTLIDFGSGRVNSTSGNTHCYIYTAMNSSPGLNSNDFSNYSFSGYKNGSAQCINFSIPSYGFVVENTGALAANVSMNSSDPTWLNGTDYVGYYQYKLSAEGGTACAEGNTQTWTNFSSSDPQICGNLGTNVSKNAFQVAILVGIPRDLTNATHQDTVTFTATAP